MTERRRNRRRVHRFESCQDHSKQTILLENIARIPKITPKCRNSQEPSSELGRHFLFEPVRCCKSVAITMDRTQWFKVQVGSSSLSVLTQYCSLDYENCN